MSKIIKAVFGAGETTKCCPQWQYDYNTILKFVGLELPQNYEVDLSNSKTGQSVTVLGDEDGCTIPAQLFIPGSSIFAWVYVVGDDYGYTRCQVEIPIAPRAQHTGDPPTPEQQDALDQAIALLNEATDAIPDAIEAALSDAKESGEFDGAQIWFCTSVPSNTVVPFSALTGKPDATPAVGDFVYGPEAGESGDPTTLYYVAQTQSNRAKLTSIGSIRGVDGADGNSIWTTTQEPLSQTYLGHTTLYYTPEMLTGRESPEPQAGDIVIKGASVAYYILSTLPNMLIVVSIGSIKGADGQGVPSGGTTGQYLKKKSDSDFDTEWASGGGGGGTSDYSDLSNKPQIEGVTLSGNKTASDLGLAKSSDIPSVPAAATATPSDLGTAAVGSSTKYAREDHVHKKPTYSKSDVGLGNVDNVQQYSASNPPPYPVTSVNSKTGAVSLSIPGGADELEWTGGNLGQSSPPATVEGAVTVVYNAIPTTPADIGAAPAVTEVTNTSTGDVTLALDPGKIYHFTGAISSLTLTLTAASAGQIAQYHFDFDSGSTAATVSITGVTWQGGSFAPEASTHYEVDILNGYGLYIGWEVTP